MNALKLINKSLLVALIYAFGAPGSAIAQETPICTHQYYDADGDGFGWQNEASCLITSSSEPPPDFTNKSTGEPVTLTRPYWDGNTDLANRTIRCDRYDYQQASGDYQRPVAPATYNALPELSLTHQGISTSRKYSPYGTDQDQEFYGWYGLSRENLSLQTFGWPLWRTNDGLYESPELLQAPYIEIINPQGVKAIRIWFNEGDRFNTSYDFISSIHSTEGYFQCYDESGADFGPTGQIGTPGATPEPALQDLVISGYSNDLYEPDEVVNLETGERVQLSKANWNYNNDIAGRLIRCEERGYDTSCANGGTYSRGCAFADIDPTYYLMPWHLTDSTANHGANLFWWKSFQGIRGNAQVSFTDGLIEPVISPGIAPSIERVVAPIFLRSDLVELVDDDKVRVWREPTDIGFSSYYECSVYPTGTADAPNNPTDGSPPNLVQNCVDTVPVGDGWGWDGTSSCRVTGTAEPTLASCVDTDPVGDGWGWDGTSSCRVTGTAEPTVTSCVDTDPVGDGWGWDGTSSCRVTGAAEPTVTSCVDTDPVGDGWGWNGTSSCRVTGAAEPTVTVCLDTDPIGDGWGWDGTSSCRVTGAAEPTVTSCVDTDPVGDGWGWNGSSSCRVN